MDVTRRIIATLGLAVLTLVFFLGLGAVNYVLNQLGIGWVYWALLGGFVAWRIWVVAGDLYRYKR